MKTKKIIRIFILTSFILFSTVTCIKLHAQYVSPNQPGRMGGNTQPSDPSLNTVVTSTYYGTNGTLSGQGTIIATDKNPAIGSVGANTRVLHFFKGAAADASYSWYTSPFTASDGNIYSNSYYGGTNNLGATYTYKVDAANTGACVGNTQVIYNMGGTGGTYGNYSNLNELSDGKLYIPETAGGTSAYGRMTSMNKDGSAVQNIHNFNWGAAAISSSYTTGAQAQPGFTTWGAVYGYDGAYPYGFPTEGPDGMVYGTTLYGGLGITNQAFGTVYKMNKDGTGYKILAYGSTLSVGTYNSADGSTVAGVMPFAIPVGNVAFDQAGVYAYFFGSYVNSTNWGNVCRVKIDGSAPVEIVHTFVLTGTTPKSLYRGPIIINNMLYGTSVNGGTTNYGTIWSLDLSKLNPTDNPIDANGVNNTLVKLHDFNVTNGAYPYASLIFDGTNLYGSTQQGGSTPNAYGTVYKIKPDGTGFQTILITENATNSCPGGTPIDQQVFNVYYPGAERVTLVNLQPSTLNCFSCIKNPSTPLALNNVSLSTIINKCSVKLMWKAEYQDDINYFVVMRKARNETGFTEVSKIIVDRNKPLPEEYSYEFQNVASEDYEFKIKIVDINATSEYSNIVSAISSCKTNSISIYPNPINKILNININNIKQKRFEISVIDNIGRTILRDKIDIMQNSTVLKYDLSKYPNGLYSIIVVNDGKTQSFKAIKVE